MKKFFNKIKFIWLYYWINEKYESKLGLSSIFVGIIGIILTTLFFILDDNPQEITNEAEIEKIGVEYGLSQKELKYSRIFRRNKVIIIDETNKMIDETEEKRYKNSEIHLLREYFVQITSQKNLNDAKNAFMAIQLRFPSVLRSEQPNIEIADLGDKGIYYRVRVGPMKRDAANSLCSSLRAAGGDCFVHRK